jgi:hypothetical protein
MVIGALHWPIRYPIFAINAINAINEISEISEIIAIGIGSPRPNRIQAEERAIRI